jgi:hypothetical protein
MLRTHGQADGLNFAPTPPNHPEPLRWSSSADRIACSYLNSSLVRNGMRKPVTATRPMLVGDELVRDSDLCFYCEHVVSELRQFYEDEYAMLELLACRQLGDFVEFARDGSW